MAETTSTTHNLECPDCDAKFTVSKTPAEFEDPEDETVCPKCGEIFLSAIDEDTNELYLLAEDDDDEEDGDLPEDEESEDEEDED